MRYTNLRFTYLLTRKISTTIIWIHEEDARHRQNWARFVHLHQTCCILFQAMTPYFSTSNLTKLHTQTSCML